MEVTLASRRRGRGKEALTNGFAKGEGGPGGEGYPHPFKGEFVMYMNQYLEINCKEVSPHDFYRDIFPEGELEEKGKYVDGEYTGIAISVNDKTKKVKRYSVTNELSVIDELCKCDDFCLMSPISYAGKARKSDNARFLYALAIDLDGIKQEDYKGVPVGIDTLFWQFDGHGPSNYLPLPTYIVSSGTGLHLYYIFEKPIPLFKNIVKELEKYKKRLTWQLWTQGVSHLSQNVQYESLFQGFRIPGTITKNGKRARVFMVDNGTKVTMEYLNRFVPEDYRTKDFAYKSKLTLSAAKKKYPEWYDRRVVRGEAKCSWTCKRDLYDWWKRKLEEGATDGHRYWCIQTLAVYAMKCGISREELETDAFGYIELLDSIGKREDNPFTTNDVLKALEAYNASYVTYPVKTISDRTGIRIEKNKRNYRKQKLHLKIARATLEIMNDEKGIALQGRPDAKDMVLRWRRFNPEGKKIDCERETGLSRKTVLKWWDYKENENG